MFGKFVPDEFLDMNRILVFSDTHGIIKTCRSVIERIPADVILHAGDIGRDVVALRREFPDRDIRAVCGNNEFVCPDPYTDVITVAGVRIFLTHGHLYRVKYDSDYRTLAAAAKEENCDVAVFGHTHIPYEGETDGVVLLNPGSIGFFKTYGVIEIEDGNVRTCIIKEE